MDKTEFAKMLDGRQYTEEITPEEEKLATENNLVIVFGASDDLMELRGAINNEIGCFDGGSAFVDSDGDLILQEICEDCGKCKYFQDAKSKAHELKALWCGGEAEWKYEIDVPTATFNIMEDDELYCIGIIFSLDDIKREPASK